MNFIGIDSLKKHGQINNINMLKSVKDEQLLNCVSYNKQK